MELEKYFGLDISDDLVYDTQQDLFFDDVYALFLKNGTLEVTKLDFLNYTYDIYPNKKAIAKTKKSKLKELDIEFKCHGLHFVNKDSETYGTFLFDETLMNEDDFVNRLEYILVEKASLESILH